MIRKGNIIVFFVVGLIVILVMVMFAIPNLFLDYEDLSRDAVLADGYAMENAAKLYCTEITCEENQELTWGQLIGYCEGIDLEYYESDTNLVVAKKSSLGWKIHLEAMGIGELEIGGWVVPSNHNNSIIVIDDN